MQVYGTTRFILVPLFGCNGYNLQPQSETWLLERLSALAQCEVQLSHNRNSHSIHKVFSSMIALTKKTINAFNNYDPTTDNLCTWYSYVFN